MTKRITKLFIANRGEIMRRIGLTARRLGVETVAIAEQGSQSLYLLDAVDELLRVEEETTSVYLDGPRLIKMAKDAGCDAVHPGFGFLSENETFARNVEKAGLIWVGPKPDAIAAMASKSEARTVAEKAGVPVVPGLQDFPVPETADGDFSELQAFATKTGYPLLIKAALGGGGKGMRLVERDADLVEMALRARSEAISSFDDGALICERYIGQPRHVEVQILADQHGNAYAIGDRDCSVQRRHQKVIEEAPAPQIPDATRSAMHRAACELAKEVGYDSTGTVEFLLDWSPKARKSDTPDFFFLEMNTRLQVEHPVTEEVFDVDLVEWQLRVASGETLDTDLDGRAPRGHSLEVRLYAEDPEQNYLPQPGDVATFVPASGPGLRWETGLDISDRITGKFDPMIAKLIATGPSREAALGRLVQALENTFFAGPKNNLEWVRVICEQSEFRETPVDTSFLGQQHDALLSAWQEDRESRQEFADQIFGRLDGYLGNHASATNSLYGTIARAFGAAQTSTAAGLRSYWRSSHQMHGADVTYARVVDDSSAKLATAWVARLAGAESTTDYVSIAGRLFTRVHESSSHGTGAASAGDGLLVAPVPGKVVAIKVAKGDSVEQDQPVFILESMKMEFEVKASKSGKIEDILVATGDQITAGTELATWEESE